MLGRDGRTTLTTIQLGIDDGTAKRVLPEVIKGLSRFEQQGLRVYLVGQAAAFAATNEVGASALARVEVMLLPLVVGILLILYRSVAAAILSLVVGVVAIVLATGALTWLAGITELNVIVQSIATMLGLGVSVDYSLIMIRRFIDELSGSDPGAALATTLRTAGHTVAASGTTVAVALASLLIVDLPLIRSIALAAIIGVVAAVVTCLVVLPAALHLLGARASAWRVPWMSRDREPGRRRWARFARAIMARPVTALAISCAALAVAALPTFGLQTSSFDSSVLPKSSSVREGYDLVEQQFGKGAVEPILVVVQTGRSFSGRADFDRLNAMTAGIGALDHVARVHSPVPALQALSPADPSAPLKAGNFDGLPPDSQAVIDRFVSRDRSMIAIDVFPNTRAAQSTTKELVGQIRSVVAANAAPDWRASVGGLSAVLASATERISNAIPLVLVTMLAVIYLLLTVTFRSLLLPCKAIALNVLSVGAAFGAVVLVFQYGFFAGVLGISYVGLIQNYVPILLIAVLFSLSTDYEVFLLSRVRERYERTGDNNESVVYGLVETAPLISGAAVLMATIFAGFLTVPLVTVQQLGFATAIAIVIDGTAVRLVMVPAAMRLMGRWNWWMPGARFRYRGRHRRESSTRGVRLDAAGAHCVP